MRTQLQRKRADETTIPDRLYFKIGDVARICGVEPYVLRFWESQFPQLKPNKSGTGQRLYRKRDVEMALEIKKLVHAQGYTLNGARQALGQKQKPATPAVQQPAAIRNHTESSNSQASAAVQRIKMELKAIAGMLATEPATTPVQVQVSKPPQKRRTRFAIASGELFPS